MSKGDIRYGIFEWPVRGPWELRYTAAHWRGEYQDDGKPRLMREVRSWQAACRIANRLNLAIAEGGDHAQG